MHVHTSGAGDDYHRCAATHTGCAENQTSFHARACWPRRELTTPRMCTQVVLGTNTSIGELRSWDERLSLSNPIVLLDEAGQVGLVDDVMHTSLVTRYSCSTMAAMLIGSFLWEYLRCISLNGVLSRSY